MMTKRRIAIYLSVIGLLLLLLVVWYVWAFNLARQASHAKFDSMRAYSDVQAQVAFGPRIPGSEAHAEAVEWIRTQLTSVGWEVVYQQAAVMGHPIVNIIARRGEAPPQLILGAHYDSRIYADHDPDPAKRTQPVPGADDGASGVAVLLELARSLPTDTAPMWMVFFDAEDNGDIPGWDWLLGSRAFVTSLTVKPKAMVLVDMVGEPDLAIPMESYSDPQLRSSIWNTAANLGYGKIFIPQVKYTIEDDHLPFIQAGIPSVDIIDLDYKYWHTTSDTPDHVSAQSLQIVGDVLWTWLSQETLQSK